MGSALVRQWLVLSMLPHPPRRLDAATIEARLRARGVEVHRRTIQRDLVELSRIFPIVADLRSKPYGWRWTEPSPILGRAPRVAAKKTSVRLRGERSATLAVLAQLGATDGRDRADVVEATVDDVDEARRVFLGHADEVEVIAPRELRAEIAARAQRALDRHRDH